MPENHKASLGMSTRQIDIEHRDVADNNQLDIQLKINVLELVSACPAKVTPAATVAYYITRTIRTFDVSRNDIDYRAEGNANIVLAIPQQNQVLRLPKKHKRLLTILFFHFNGSQKVGSFRIFLISLCSVLFTLPNNLHLTLRAAQKMKS